MICKNHDLCVSERSSIHPFTSSHDFLYLILQGVTSVNNTQSSPRSNIIIAIMLSALTYWLFAQSFINMGPLVGQTYQTSPAVLNLSISLTSFATGIFMVAAGDIADKIGQLRMTYMGLIISMFASLLLIISDITALLIIGRILQGLSAAILLPSTVGVLNNQFKENI